MANEDEVATKIIQKLNWLPPVDSIGELPAEAPERALCLVSPPDPEELDVIYERKDGAWIRVD